MNSKDLPLSEYPYPSFKRDSYLSLNGKWDYKIIKDLTLSKDFNKQIIVPYAIESSASEVNIRLDSTDHILYHRKVVLDKDFIKDFVFLHFEGIDQISYIYINNILVYKHIGGYNPFKVEISDYIKNNRFDLKVIVVDEEENSQFSRGKQVRNNSRIFYKSTTGIYKPVWIESTHNEFIKEAIFTGDFDKKAVKILIKTSTDGDVFIKIDKQKCCIKSNVETLIKLDEFKEWNPESPYLYRCQVAYKNDIIESYFGVRKIETRKDKFNTPRIYLNNKPYFITGLLDQGYYKKGELTPFNYKDYYKDLSLIKKLGFNAVRVHIKLELDQFYFLCDSLGLLVIQDFINGGGPYNIKRFGVLPTIFGRSYHPKDNRYKFYCRDDSFAREQFIIESKNIIDTLYNHPSVIMYTIFNEGWGQFDANTNYKVFKDYDKSRLYDATSGWIDQGLSDVNSYHNYFFRHRNHKDLNRPYFISECGGYSLFNKEHFNGKNVFGYKKFNDVNDLNKRIEKLYLKEILPLIKKGLSGIIYTQYHDWEDEVNGIVTFDRKEIKIKQEMMKEINKALLNELKR